MEESLPRKLVAILYADVSGYSRLTGQDELGTHAQLSSGLDLITDRIAVAGGRVVHYAGDAVLADFDSVIAATRCAIGIQEAIAAVSDQYPVDQRLLFRIGINLGDVIVDRDDIYGDGVNIAARLEGIASPGGICVSEAVRNEVHGKVEADFQDLGDQALKNIEKPVRAYKLVFDVHAIDDISAVTICRFSAHTTIVGLGSDEETSLEFANRQLPSIMILPFRNIGGSEEQTAFVDGFRLSIQSVLVKLSGLFLVNAPPMEAFRGREVSATQAGKEAGVQYVLEGAAQIAGGRIRVTLQLTNAAEGQVMWSDQFDRILDDIFELQDEITAEVVTTLGVLFNASTDSIEKFVWWNELTDWRAKEMAIRGINYLYKGTQADNAVARRVFEELVEMQPDQGQGLGIVALTHWLDLFRGWSQSPVDSRRRASEFAERAVALDDPDGFGRMVLGYERLAEGRHEEALALSERSATVRSSCPTANGLYGRVLLYSGQPEAAIRQTKHAIRAARWYPPWMVNVLSEAYRDLGKFGPSISAAHESLKLDAENLDACAIICTGYSLGSFPEEASKAGEGILRLNPDFSIEEYASTKPYKNDENITAIIHPLQDAGLS